VQEGGRAQRERGDWRYGGDRRRPGATIDQRHLARVGPRPKRRDLGSIDGHPHGSISDQVEVASLVAFVDKHHLHRDLVDSLRTLDAEIATRRIYVELYSRNIPGCR
jgi:hypothetical protein